MPRVPSPSSVAVRSGVHIGVHGRHDLAWDWLTWINTVSAR